MRSYLSLPALLGASLALSSSGLATIVSVAAARDNTLYEGSTGALSNGAGDYLFAGNTLQSPGTSLRRGLLDFDIASSIPAGSTINSVSLTLFMSRAIIASQDVGLHRLTQDWGEGASNAGGQEGAGAAAVLGDATWLHTFSSTSLWATAGGDFNALASATTTVFGNQSYSWSSPQLAADVQDMLDNPGGDHGWLLLGDEATAGSAQRFNSRENGANPPSLTIDYTIVPEPSVTGVLGVGLFLGLLRRRRS